MNKQEILDCLNKMASLTKNMPSTLTELVIKEYGKDPFLILISCLLSLRSRDPVTYKVVKVLFSRIRTAQDLINIKIEDLENIIHPIGFYKRKAQVLKSVSKELIERFNSKVPRTKPELLSIKGIGPKTANLVLSEAFDEPAICVDTHVHRIANHLRWVKTKNPDQTEKELKHLIPKSKWREVNTVLVKWGQNICKSNVKYCKCPA